MRDFCLENWCPPNCWPKWFVDTHTISLWGETKVDSYPAYYNIRFKAVIHTDIFHPFGRVDYELDYERIHLRQYWKGWKMKTCGSEFDFLQKILIPFHNLQKSVISVQGQLDTIKHGFPYLTDTENQLLSDFSNFRRNFQNRWMGENHPTRYKEHTWTWKQQRHATSEIIKCEQSKVNNFFRRFTYLNLEKETVFSREYKIKV